jgi:hypothetical protein
MAKIFQNEYLMAAIKVLLVVYAINFAPRLPANVQKVFDNSITKMAGMALIIVVAIGGDFQMAILLAIALVMSINLLSGRGILENYTEFVKQKFDNSKLVEPKSIIYPGCLGIKMVDLLDAFNKDAVALQNTVRYVFHKLMAADTDPDSKARLLRYARMAGLPYNLEMSDETAPLIATMLMQYGFKFGETCHAPQ